MNCVPRPRHRQARRSSLAAVSLALGRSHRCAGSSMTAALVSRRRRSRFVAIFIYTLRSCIPPKRWAAVLLPCAGALLFGLLARAVDLPADRAFANVAAEGIFSLMMPMAALVVGDAVLGAEVRAGTFHFTWLSPAPTWQIVLGRWLGGVVVAVVTIVPATAAAAVVAGSPSSAGPALVAAAAGAIAVRRPVRRHRVHHPAHGRLVAGDRLPRRAAARRCPHRASPSCRRHGSRGPSSSASSTTRRSGWCVTASRRAGPPSSAWRSSPPSPSPSPTGGCGTSGSRAPATDLPSPATARPRPVARRRIRTECARRRFRRRHTLCECVAGCWVARWTGAPVVRARAGRWGQLDVRLRRAGR